MSNDKAVRPKIKHNIPNYKPPLRLPPSQSVSDLSHNYDEHEKYAISLFDYIHNCQILSHYYYGRNLTIVAKRGYEIHMIGKDCLIEIT